MIVAIFYSTAFLAERKVSFICTMQRNFSAHKRTQTCTKSLSTKLVKLAREMSTKLSKKLLKKVRISKLGNSGFTSLRDNVQKKKKKRIAVAPLHWKTILSRSTSVFRKYFFFPYSLFRILLS